MRTEGKRAKSQGGKNPQPSNARSEEQTAEQSKCKEDAKNTEKKNRRKERQSDGEGTKTRRKMPTLEIYFLHSSPCVSNRCGRHRQQFHTHLARNQASNIHPKAIVNTCKRSTLLHTHTTLGESIN